MLDGQLSFVLRDAGSYVGAARIVETLIAAAVLAPGKMRRIDVNDLHRCERSSRFLSPRPL